MIITANRLLPTASSLVGGVCSKIIAYMAGAALQSFNANDRPSPSLLQTGRRLGRTLLLGVEAQRR